MGGPRHHARARLRSVCTAYAQQLCHPKLEVRRTWLSVWQPEPGDVIQLSYSSFSVPPSCSRSTALLHSSTRASLLLAWKAMPSAGVGRAGGGWGGANSTQADCTGHPRLHFTRHGRQIAERQACPHIYTTAVPAGRSSQSKGSSVCASTVTSQLGAVSASLHRQAGGHRGNGGEKCALPQQPLGCHQAVGVTAQGERSSAPAFRTSQLPLAIGGRAGLGPLPSAPQTPQGPCFRAITLSQGAKRAAEQECVRPGGAAKCRATGSTQVGGGVAFLCLR